MNSYILYRNKCIHFLYTGFLKPVFFKFDPEDIHDHMIALGKLIGKNAILRILTARMFNYTDTSLKQIVCGITFRNPVGLAAGFDKNAELIQVLPSVGFGFMEVGSITGEPCEGNPRPRLWRLPKSKSLVVYYGLKNKGCEVLGLEIKHVLEKQKKVSVDRIPVGTSIAMTNCKANVDQTHAILDYAKAFRMFADSGDYTTINISCPNAEGGQPFIKPEALESLLSKIDTIPTKKPIFIKLSPDISIQEVDMILDIAHAHRIHGVIATNLTKKRNFEEIEDTEVPEKGGLSGKLVQGASDALISHIYKKECTRNNTKEKQLSIIGCGGIFTAEDAYKKIRLGASLLQMITGMVFEGPQVISEINRGLVHLLKKDGFKNISDAIGIDSI